MKLKWRPKPADGIDLPEAVRVALAERFMKLDAPSIVTRADKGFIEGLYAMTPSKEKYYVEAFLKCLEQFGEIEIWWAD